MIKLIFRKSFLCKKKRNTIRYGCCRIITIYVEIIKEFWIWRSVENLWITPEENEKSKFNCCIENKLIPFLRFFSLYFSPSHAKEKKLRERENKLKKKIVFKYSQRRKFFFLINIVKLVINTYRLQTSITTY